MGFILYEGPGLDGTPIVAIVTGEDDPSENSKTGKMLQVWILLATMDPIKASRTGADQANCGADCPHRGTPVEKERGWADKRTCYVMLNNAPTKIWQKYIDQGYSRPSREEALQIMQGWLIRFGAYGDPVCLPVDLVRDMCRVSSGWTGYTHQWHRGFQPYQPYFMASCDSSVQRAMANSKGWRTFRVGQTTEPGEVNCPASEESGHRVICAQCKLCSGQHLKGAKNIQIRAHGTSKRRVLERELAVV